VSSITSVRWVMLDTLISKSIVLFSLIIIARILGPELVGIMAVIALVRESASILSDFGLSQAIINFKNPKNNQLATLYTVNWSISFIVFCIMFFFTAFIASFFSEPLLKDILPYVAINFLLAPIGQQVNALLRKSMDFKTITKISIATTILGAIISITGAHLGFGVWAIVVSGLVSNVTMQVAYLFVARQRQLLHGFSLDFKESSALLSFGMYRVGASGLNFMNSRMDQLIIGSIFGSTALGLYLMATSWTLNIMEQISGIAAKVAFPAISKFKEDIPRVKAAYLRLVNRTCTINAALFLGLFIIAKPLVNLLLGPTWLELIPLIKLMCIYVLIRSLGNLNGLLAMGLGKANWAFYWNLAVFSITPIALYLAGKYGSLETVIYALIGLYSVFMIIMYYFWTRRLIGSCLKKYTVAFGVPYICGIFMIIVIHYVRIIIPPSNDILEIIMAIVIGGTVYMSASWIFNRDAIHDILNLLIKRKKTAVQ